MSRWVKRAKPVPNRSVTEAWPSLQGHMSWMSMPWRLAPPAIRVVGMASSGVASIMDWEAWLMLCWADVSTYWPSPERVWRSNRAISAAPAASEAALWYAWGTVPPARSGARSLSPVSTMLPADAWITMSDAAQSA